MYAVALHSKMNTCESLYLASPLKFSVYRIRYCENEARKK